VKSIEQLRARWVWIDGKTASEKRIGIEGPCSGSPHCAGAIHIERTDGSYASQEIHLTPSEIRRIRKLLKASLRLHKAGEHN
jgi:hypothetical protein